MAVEDTHSLLSGHNVPSHVLGLLGHWSLVYLIISCKKMKPSTPGSIMASDFGHIGSILLGTWYHFRPFGRPSQGGTLQTFTTSVVCLLGMQKHCKIMRRKRRTFSVYTDRRACTRTMKWLVPPTGPHIMQQHPLRSTKPTTQCSHPNDPNHKN